ncbi:hypothetical protein DYB37_009127 [Aphanomyces astaci]|uniref:HECT-type E3 ubiquitin transferase n=1 Tax=Aphanomyces astaci TaxID=112090 RepID=A0A397B3S2_APHAT|nr:hypothetical protein DYB36_009621 [Aphanomyces astaci]RHY68365.1 hypothetical protein DYB38_004179 [Aphanomyces astaci]RHY80145.1 hypothetical protein DYB30_004725 [Aphanomyces astaci]RHY94012.1 hypothetical protein DYB35_002172 [Aphanomyces astaci]RHZ14740.1 hypothetical protein DYB37_009127 [Aphanomyces astaci]
MLDTQVFQSVESLALTFAVTEDIGSGKLNVVELVEGGVDVEVTDANKHDYVQRMLILCGLPDIDVDDWKMHTNTTDAVRTSPLWTIVADLSLEDRAKFLQYTTGSPRVPVQGFSGLTSYDGRICHFSIRGVTYTQGKYPVVHTCFNRIDLPAYPSKAALEEAIAMLLLTDATGFTLN